MVQFRTGKGTTPSGGARGAPNCSKHHGDNVQAGVEQRGTQLNQPETGEGYRLQEGYRQRVPQAQLGPV